jgi:hypothetical protein
VASSPTSTSHSSTSPLRNESAIGLRGVLPFLSDRFLFAEWWCVMVFVKCDTPC